MAPTLEASPGEPLRLAFRQETRFVVQTQDDRYFATSEKMAEACRQSADFEAWKNEFADFLADLHEWMRDRSQNVCGCYLAPGDGTMVAFVTTKGERYRFDLDDALTDLELELHGAYPRCPVEIVQMPSASTETLRSFFSPNTAFQVYGQPRTAPPEG